MHMPAAVLLMTLLSLGSSIPLHAATPVAEDSAANPYTATYVSHRPAPSGQQATAEIYAGRDKVKDYQRLLEDGYDLLGYSSFESGDVGPDKLAEQAGKLNADLVLVYTAGVERPQAAGARYEYFASYWTRLPPPLLGLHVQRDAAAEENAPGLEVLAVIKDSPAARAGLQQGDILMGLGEEKLQQSDQLGALAQRYAGKTVEISFVRMGARLRTPVTVGTR